MKKANPSPQKDLAMRRGLAAPLPPDEEKAILEDVRHTVWQAYQTKTPPESSPSRQPLSLPRWQWVGAFGSAVALGTFLLWPSLKSTPTTSWNRLELQGTAHIQGATSHQEGASTSLDGQRITLTVPPKQQIHLQDRGRWSLHASAGAKLSILQKNKHHHQIQIEEGRVGLEITPNQIKHFEVELPHYHILVKGTAFSIQRQARWWRVEMTSGRIALTAPKGRPSSPAAPKKAHPTSELALVRQEGARIDIEQGTILRYLVPPPEHQAPLKRVRWWLQQHQPQIALQWVADLPLQDAQEKSLRADLLQEIAEYFRTQKQWEQAIHTLLQIQQLALPQHSELALPEALALCRKLPKQPLACMTVYRLSLQQQPDHPFAEHALFWLAAGLYQQEQQNNRATPSPENASSLLWRYAKRYPQGEHLRDVTTMLLASPKHRAQHCKKLARLLPNAQRLPAWKRACQSP